METRYTTTWTVTCTDAASCYSAILGGCNNCATEAFFGSILGGGDNCIPVGNDYAAVAGCNVTAIVPCAMHVNQYYAKNTPLFAGAFPGLYQYTPIPAALAALYGLPLSACFIVTT